MAEGDQALARVTAKQLAMVNERLGKSLVPLAKILQAIQLHWALNLTPGHFCSSFVFRAVSTTRRVSGD
jgi:hypothetical protein